MTANVKKVSGAALGAPDGHRDAAPASLDPIVREARRFQLDSAVSSVWFAEETAYFVTDDRAVLRARIGGNETLIQAHDDVILAAHGDGTRVATAGADGVIATFGALGEPRTVAEVDRNKWSSGVAVGLHGVAWGVGRDVFVRLDDGTCRHHAAPAPISVLSFSPDGDTLAIGHRSALTLWRHCEDEVTHVTNDLGPFVALNFSPHSRYLAASCYEALVVLFDLAEETSISLAGPTAQVRSASWNSRSDVLLTAGARQLMIWPIYSRRGSLSSMPRLMAPYPELVTAVAHHPSQPIAAVGYADGTCMLVRLSDGAEIVLKAGRSDAVSAIVWSHAGEGLAVGCEDGSARLFVINFS